MKIRNFSLYYSTVPFVLTFIISCSTSQSLRELSEITGTNVAFVSTELQKFAKTQSLISQQRADSIAYLDHITSEALNKLEAKKTAIELSGESEKIKIINNVQSAADRLTKLHHEAVKQEVIRREKVISGQQELKIPSKKLGAIAKRLAKLAEEEDPETQLRFYGLFIRDVVTEIDKL